jgi:energy-converting hydrogenase A subunit M
MAAEIQARERFRSSLEGLRQRAKELRDRALQLAEGRDRDLVLCLASDFARRADHEEQRPKAEPQRGA